MPTLSDLIQDWGGFELLVAALHRTGNISVERDVKLTGRSGVSRQCDVVLRYRMGMYEHLAIVECKYWQKRVSRLHVDALTATLRDLNASKGVIMTASGFQSGAIEYAEHVGIDLFRVRELSDEEWGAPGRIIHIIQQFVRRTIIGAQALGARSLDGCLHPVPLTLNLGDSGEPGATTLTGPPSVAGMTLNSLIEKVSKKSMTEFMKPSFTINGGRSGIFYMRGGVKIAPPGGLTLHVGERKAHIEVIQLDLGIRIDQSEIRIDRSEKLAFALAVEDCISSSVTMATKVLDTGVVTHTPLRTTNAPVANEDVYKNGSVLRVFLDSWFDPCELANLTPTGMPPEFQGQIAREQRLADLLDHEADA